jgi:hypothetical protein
VAVPFFLLANLPSNQKIVKGRRCHHQQKKEEKMEVVVSDPQKHYTISPGSTQVTAQHVDYKIEVKLNGASCEVRRRFKEFAYLHSVFQAHIPGAVLPLLPNKGITSQISQKTANDQIFIETRTKVSFSLSLFESASFV